MNAQVLWDIVSEVAADVVKYQRLADAAKKVADLDASAFYEALAETMRAVARTLVRAK